MAPLNAGKTTRGQKRPTLSLQPTDARMSDRRYWELIVKFGGVTIDRRGGSKTRDAA